MYLVNKTQRRDDHFSQQVSRSRLGLHSIRNLTTSLDMSDSSGASAPHHGHEWVVIVFNLLPFFGGQFAPLFHDAMAMALKAYITQIVGPKNIAQGLLVTEADLAAGLLHGHLLAYCRRRWRLTVLRYETDGKLSGWQTQPADGGLDQPLKAPSTQEAQAQWGWRICFTSNTVFAVVGLMSLVSEVS